MRSPSYWILPLCILVFGLAAAPFYGNTMEGVLWMGRAIKAMCGF